MFKRFRSLFLLLACVSIGAVALTSQAAGNSGRPATTGAQRRHAPQVMTSEKTTQHLAAHFSLFSRRKARAAIGVSPVPVLPGLISRFGLDTATATTVTAPNGEVVTVYVGTDSVCLVAAPLVSGGMTPAVCGNVAGADSGSMRMEVGSPATGKHELIGLVPDGNATVSVAPSGGQTASVPVHNNVYATSLPGDNYTLSDHDSGGQSQTW